MKKPGHFQLLTTCGSTFGRLLRLRSHGVPRNMHCNAAPHLWAKAVMALSLSLSLSLSRSLSECLLACLRLKVTQRI